MQGRRKRCQNLKPGCELLYHQARGCGAVCNRGPLQRRFLAGHCPAPRNRQTMKERLKVLLVEDNAGDARLIQESLAEASDQFCDLEIAESLRTGLQRLHLGGIDAMLLDLALPDSFGMETFVRAKAQALGVAIIVLTGLADDSLALKLVQGGAQDFVAKVDVSGNNLTRAISYAVFCLKK